MVSGSVSATLGDSPHQSCSISSFLGGAGVTRSLVLNGAQTTSGPTYTLVLTVFPYTGRGTYDNVGQQGGTRLLLAGSGAPDQGLLQGASGKVVVDAQSSTVVSGSMDVQLSSLQPGAAPARLSGRWRCPLVAPSPAP